MKTRIVSLIFAAFFFSLPVVAGVTNSTSGGPVYATIQAAVDAAYDGDTLRISTGHYTERISIRQKSLALKGGYLPDYVTRTNLADLTCIDAEASGSGLTVLSNCTVVMEYLMITNGAALVGGGIIINVGVTLIAEYCAVSYNIGFIGGGIAVGWNSSLVLNDSAVSNNNATSGAGMYLVSNAVVTLLNGSQISYNTANNQGGGAYVLGTLNILSNSLITGNQALSSSGGGFAASGEADINISDSMVRNNSAGTDGGAIYIDKGSLAFTGGWTLRENAAGGNGGAIAVMGQAVASFKAEKYCLIYSNRARGGHGGVVYLGNNTTIRLYATDGYIMYVYANSASQNGGALYADNGGYFDNYGLVLYDRNRADNGGAIYLSNGSRVWLDDYVDDRPQLWDNRADSGCGGAVYAENSLRVQCTGATFGRNDIGNQATVNGGAVYLNNSPFIAEKCIFQDNIAAQDGGAIWCANNTTARFAKVTLFTRNAAQSGGAIYATSNMFVSLNATDGAAPVFISNTSYGVTSYDGGGALYASQGTRLSAYNASFIDNVSSNNGGALWLRNAAATIAADFTAWPGSNMPPVSFFHNTAENGLGGAVYISHGSRASLSDASVISNTAALGGGFCVVSSTADLVNVVIYKNSAGVRTAYARVRSVHCTIINNHVQGLDGSAGTHSVSNCIVRGHNVNISPSNDVYYSNVGGGYATGTGNIDADPLFVNPAADNLALTLDSPCVDAGVNAGISWDCIGAVRPMNAGYDMGAYEMDPTPIQFVSPVLLDFGDVVIGDVTSQIVRVENRGNSPVIGTVNFVPAPIFTVAPNTYAIPGLNATNLIVTFSPPVEFAWSQTVVFASNGGTQDVVFIGTGIPEPFAVVLLILALIGCRFRRP